MDPLPGYVFEERLGRGGMGVVYRARQLALDRVVAVKMILDGAHADEADRARFLREAKTLAQLQHPNIVQVHEVGAYQGRPYLAMEYVAGGSLEERLRQQPLPPTEAAELVRTLARAVQVAHDSGIVHRDLKPANVLLQEGLAQRRKGAKAEQEEQNKRLNNSSSSCPSFAPLRLCESHSSLLPKISDFGLAKRLDDDSGQTRTGAIVGTPSYMAPEQATGQGKHVGPLADVYALGAILYECLTGRPPFRAAHVAETLFQVVQQEPVSPRQLNPSVPRDLETLCLKCLEKTPERRCQSAAELADELERFLAGQPVLARPVGRLERGWRWCRRNPVVASLATLLLLLLFAASLVSTGVALHMRQLADSESLAKQDALTREQGERDARQTLRGQLSRQYVANGEQALDAEDYGRALLWFARALELDEGDAERAPAHQLRLAATWRRMPRLVGFYPHDGPIKEAEMSPDGRLVATAGYDHTARLWEAHSSKPLHTIRHDSFVYCVRFSPDGHRLATGSADATACVWEVASGRRVAGPFLHAEGVHDVRFTPDGKKLVTGTAAPFQFYSPPAGIDGYTRRPYDSKQPAAAVWDLETGQCVRLPGIAGQVLRVAISGDGKRVALADQINKASVFELANGKRMTPPLGEPKPDRFGGLVIEVELSHDGKYLATGSYDGTHRLWDVEAARQVGESLRGRVFFHRDGRRVLGRSLWELPSGKILREAQDRRGRTLDAHWHDEEPIVLCWNRQDKLQVWDGGIEAPLSLPLMGKPRGFSRPSLHRHGRLVLVPSVPDHAGLLWDVSTAVPPPLDFPGPLSVTDGAEYTRDGLLLTAGINGVVRVWDSASGRAVGTDLRHDAAVLDTAFSPDGRLIVTACQDGRARLWDAGTRQPVGAPLVHDSPVIKAVFTPDAQHLVTLNRHPGQSQTLQVWEVATAKRLWREGFDNQSYLMPLVSPDGRWVAMGGVRGEVRLRAVMTGKPPAVAGAESMKHLYWAHTTAFSPDSRFLLSAGGDMTARIWDVQECRQRFSIPHTFSVVTGVFSPDGRKLATGTENGLVRVWDATDGCALIPELKLGGKVWWVKFSPDGRSLLAASLSGGVQVWDARSGERLGPGWTESSWVLGRFRPDGRQILTLSQQAARLWDFAPAARPVTEWQLLASVQSGGRIDATDSLQALTPAELRASWEELRRRCPAEVDCAPAQVRAWQLQEAARLKRLGRPRDAAELLGPAESP